MDAPTPLLTSYEGKMIFSLLDAAEDDALIEPTARYERWRELKHSCLKFLPTDRAALYWFMDEVAKAGLLANTWMLERWHHVQERVVKTPLASTESTAPFLDDAH